MKRIIDYWSNEEPSYDELLEGIETAQRENAVVRISWQAPYYRLDDHVYQVVLTDLDSITSAQRKFIKIETREV